MKKILAASVILLFALVRSFAFTGRDVNDKLGSFSDILNSTLPNAATQQNVYSSAWIGKLFPSAPPHLAVGVEAGVSRLDMAPLKEAAEIFNARGLPDLLVFPTVTANFRLGGLLLPFDIGFSAMYLDLKNMDSIAEGLRIKFFNIGADIRWAVLKGDGPLPQISLGAGYYYMSGGVSFDKEGFAVNLDYKCQTAFAQVQISKTFIFFTPYLGFRGIVSKGDTDWFWQASAEKIAGAPSYFDAAFAGSGSRRVNWFGQFLPQVYGGFGFNIGFFALNFCASYEFINKNWGGDFSLRFQM